MPGLGSTPVVSTDLSLTSPQGTYVLPSSSILLPSLELPSWLSSGHYRMQATLSSGGQRLGCLKVTAAIKGQ